MGMKYSTLSAFVKPNSKNFSIFFKSTAQSAFLHTERNGRIIYHTFPICQIGFSKKYDFFPVPASVCRRFSLDKWEQESSLEQILFLLCCKMSEDAV